MKLPASWGGGDNRRFLRCNEEFHHRDLGFPRKDRNEGFLLCPQACTNRRRRALRRRMDHESPPSALDCHQPHAATAALQCDRGTGCFGEHWTLNRLLGHGCSARVYVARGLGAHSGEAACKLAKNVGRVHWPRVVRTFAREAVRCRPCCHSRTPALATSASRPAPLASVIGCARALPRAHAACWLVTCVRARRS